MDVLTLSPHQSVTIQESTPELLVVEATYEPGGSAPPRHSHPAQDEHFEVLEGTIAVRVDGVGRTLGVGDTIDVPRATV
ncbi:MAG: cupin domain-containing protein, partial [Nocardioidaceae bacterium]